MAGIPTTPGSVRHSLRIAVVSPPEDRYDMSRAALAQSIQTIKSRVEAHVTRDIHTITYVYSWGAWLCTAPLRIFMDEPGANVECEIFGPDTSRMNEFPEYDRLHPHDNILRLVTTVQKDRRVKTLRFIDVGCAQIYAIMSLRCNDLLFLSVGYERNAVIETAIQRGVVVVDMIDDETKQIRTLGKRHTPD